MDDKLKVLFERVRKAAFDVSEIIKERIKESGSSAIIGRNPSDDSTMAIDKMAEDELAKRLKGEGISIVSEEGGELIKGGRITAIIDPIDGSNNFAAGIPFSAISIALCNEEGVFAGVVRNIFSGDEYWAIKGEGAFMNDKRITPEDIEGRENSVKKRVSVYFTPKPEDALRRSREIIMKGFSIRSMGSLALEMCYVADGRINGLVDLRGVCRGLDIAAATLIAGEAGAVVSDEKGEAVVIGRDDAFKRYNIIAAGRREFHDLLISLKRE